MKNEKEWQRKLKECCRSVADISDRFSFTDEEINELISIEERYPVCIPEYYLSLID